jgi:uncharacterized membrane protein YkoI
MDTNKAKTLQKMVGAVVVATIGGTGVPAWAQINSAHVVNTATAGKGGAKRISEDEAKKAALKAVPGKVTDIQIEKKQGVDRYVVEVQPLKGGEEVDVVIDLNNGKVVAIEK